MEVRNHISPYRLPTVLPPLCPKCQLASGARLVLKQEDGVIHYKNTFLYFVPLAGLVTYSEDFWHL